MNSNEYDFVIIGSGVAGLSAAIYAGRYRLKTLILDDQLGGYTTIAGEIKNYPGYISIDGYELVARMKEQAAVSGVEFYNERVTGLLRKEHCFHVATAGRSVEGHSLLIATGSKHRELGLQNERELRGKGVHYCVACDGPVYADKTVAVVGGGDSSVKGAIALAAYASKVYLIVKNTGLTAEPANIEPLDRLKDKVEVLYGVEIRELLGANLLEGVRLSESRGRSDKLSVDGLFVEIGSVPDSVLPRALGVALDENGYVIVDAMMRTNIDGVFAAGDITNFFGFFKQDITAAATGAVAATSAYEDRKLHGELCACHALPQKPQEKTR